MINSNITNKGKYLNLGLTNNDSETVHYSATTLNVLNNRMEKELEQAKLAFDPAHPATIHHLVQVYERFIDSGLLEENAQKGWKKSMWTFWKEKSVLLEKPLGFILILGKSISGPVKRQGDSGFQCLDRTFPKRTRRIPAINRNLL